MEYFAATSVQTQSHRAHVLMYVFSSHVCLFVIYFVVFVLMRKVFMCVFFASRVRVLEIFALHTFCGSFTIQKKNKKNDQDYSCACISISVFPTKCTYLQFFL